MEKGFNLSPSHRAENIWIRLGQQFFLHTCNLSHTQGMLYMSYIWLFIDYYLVIMLFTIVCMLGLLFGAFGCDFSTSAEWACLPCGGPFTCTETGDSCFANAGNVPGCTLIDGATSGCAVTQTFVLLPKLGYVTINPLQQVGVGVGVAVRATVEVVEIMVVKIIMPSLELVSNMPVHLHVL